MNQWRPCLMCNGELIRDREAHWTCKKCRLEYTGTEEDMRNE